MILNRFFFSILAFLPAFVPASAQQSLRIYEIQGQGEASPFTGQTVTTQGVVTLTLFGEGQLSGFFIQDTLGDGNPATSDGIFVYGQAEVEPGDYVRLTAEVTEYASRTELTHLQQWEVLREQLPIPYVPVSFPDGLAEAFEAHEGMAVRFTHPLYLNATSALRYDGALELGSERLRSPTDYVEPGSADYEAALARNQADRLLLDDGSTRRNPSPTPFLDADGTCRTGQVVEELLGVLDEVDGTYKVYAIGQPDWTGNERTEAPDEAALGNYSIKVCGYNLEMFFNESELQTTRLVKVLDAVDADLFGLVEVGGGSTVIESLVDALNEAKGSEEYDFIRWSGYAQPSTYTLNHIVYRKSKLEPYSNYFMINTVNPLNRKLVQAFREIATGETFIYSINHFKSKTGSGSGADADQGDGQGQYNSRRRQEAYAVLNRLGELRYYYESDRALVMGDLNSLYREDPIRVFTDAGYEDMVHRYEPESYTYCYDGQVQFLDYSLASPGMQPYVTGATVWHINADEPSFLDYDRSDASQNGPYRASDHDPVIVGLNFSSAGNQAGQRLPEWGLGLWPNPAKASLHVQSEREIRVRIFNLQGSLFLERVLPVGTSVLETGNLPSGSYLLQARTPQGEEKTLKFNIL